MSNFTIIKQKLIVIFIIIVYIISSLVFLNSVYNALFVWYDNDNSNNVNDKNIPVSTMFGYKILLNSYVIKGDCTNYNKDIVLTTNINTILIKIYNLFFTFFVSIILILVIAEYFGKRDISKIIEDSFYIKNKNIIYAGIASALILYIVSNIFNNPGKKYYNYYEDDDSTFENYLYGEYNSIIDVDHKNKLIRIIKNTNKNNFYEMDIIDYFDESNNENDNIICANILKLCKQLCKINKDTNVDVVKVFSKFIDNCEKSSDDNLVNINIEKIDIDEKVYQDAKYKVEIGEVNKKLDNIINNSGGFSNLSKKDLIEIKEDSFREYNNNDEYYIKYNDGINDVTYFKVAKIEKSFTDNYIITNLEAYIEDLKCIISEFDFLKNNLKSILSLLWWGGGVSKNIDKKNSESELEPIFFSSLLTKEYLKGCKDDEFKKFEQDKYTYFEQLGHYTIKQGEHNGSKKSFVEMMNDAKKSMYEDLFLIKGILTGVIIFTLANIVLKKYYNEYSPKTLLEIDKKIILSKIDDNIYDAVKYENFIKPLLQEGNYSVNIVLSIIIILLLLKVIPGYTYESINLDKIDCY